jgi:DNA-directed RNA polymerase subunit RPC12/RpoP
MPACRHRARPGGGGLQLGEVLRAALPFHAAGHRLPAHHWKTLNALMRCHTAALGGHLYRCLDCGREHFVAHSCRNRHCPSCQKTQADDWLQKQSQCLLPVPYFHLVFTLPHALNALIGQNQRALYQLLFDAASATLLEFARHKFQAQPGITAVLHTWSQTLLDHYHLHCLVTGGGMRLDGQGWEASGGRYLFAVRALSKVFRARFRDGLKELHAAGSLVFTGSLAALAEAGAFEELVRMACAQPWVVYSKKPFAGPQTVLAYLSRYTHRVAMGNGRLIALDAGARRVTFSYKDYADRSRRKRMELGFDEFVRRFRLHILPPRLVKIRHYGLLANRQRHARLAAARAALEKQHGDGRPAHLEKAGLAAPLKAPLRCPHCGSTNLLLIEHRVALRAAPKLCDSS